MTLRTTLKRSESLGSLLRVSRARVFAGHSLPHRRFLSVPAESPEGSGAPDERLSLQSATSGSQIAVERLQRARGAPTVELEPGADDPG